MSRTTASIASPSWRKVWNKPTDDPCQLLMRDLLEFSDFPRDHILTIRQRATLAKIIDDKHRAGVPWPYMDFGRGGARMPFVPRSCGVERARTNRPALGYCVRWTGAFWAPCGTVGERRAAGYVPLSMCWPPPKPKPGDFISSGDRALFAYRIEEVERFDPPRTAKRYTCRLWCERIAPSAVPKCANLHTFYWHKRPKGKR